MEGKIVKSIKSILSGLIKIIVILLFIIFFFGLFTITGGLIRSLITISFTKGISSIWNYGSDKTNSDIHKTQLDKTE